MRPMIRLAVVDEHEIFRRGIEACLSEDPTIEIKVSASEGPVSEPVDLAVVSAVAASRSGFACPLVVCGTPASAHGMVERNCILGVVPRNTLTTEQLMAAVHAAAVGLHVDAEPPSAGSGHGLSSRQHEVLRLLAEGADTLEIATALSYSERTVKSLIQEVQHHLGARSRAQAVALGMRQGII